KVRNEVHRSPLVSPARATAPEGRPATGCPPPRGRRGSVIATGRPASYIALTGRLLRCHNTAFQLHFTGRTHPWATVGPFEERSWSARASTARPRPAMGDRRPAPIMGIWTIHQAAHPCQEG